MLHHNYLLGSAEYCLHYFSQIKVLFPTTVGVCEFVQVIVISGQLNQKQLDLVMSVKTFLPLIQGDIDYPLGV